MFTRRRLHAILLVAVTAAPSMAGAQTSWGASASGSSDLTPRVQFGYITFREGDGRDQHEWLAGVVLWRGQPGWHEYRPMSAVESRALRERQNAMRDSLQEALGEIGASLLCSQGGSHAHCFAYTRRDAALLVLDQKLRMPGRDSALVVMVDRADGVGGPPRVIGSLVVASELPANTWPRTWQNGDTTFTVRARNAHEAIPNFLRRHPRLEFFLNEPVR